MTKLQEKFENYILTRKVCHKYGAKLHKNRDGSYGDFRIQQHWITYKKAIDDFMQDIFGIHESDYNKLIASEGEHSCCYSDSLYCAEKIIAEGDDFPVKLVGLLNPSEKKEKVIFED